MEIFSLSNDDKFKILERDIVCNVKGILIPFTERYKVNVQTKEEVFDRELEMENDRKLYELYDRIIIEKTKNKKLNKNKNKRV